MRVAHFNFENGPDYELPDIAAIEESRLPEPKVVVDPLTADDIDRIETEFHRADVNFAVMADVNSADTRIIFYASSEELLEKMKKIGDQSLDANGVKELIFRTGVLRFQHNYELRTSDRNWQYVLRELSIDGDLEDLDFYGPEIVYSLPKDILPQPNENDDMDIRLSFKAKVKAN